MKTKLKEMLTAYRNGTRGPIEYHELANLLVEEGDGQVYLDAVDAAAAAVLAHPAYVRMVAAPQVVADERALPPMIDHPEPHNMTWSALEVAAIQQYARAALAAAPVQAQYPDDAAVDRFAAVMKDKLAVSRVKGRGGWDDPARCSIEKLAAMLCQHVEKGDPVDIANFAMMIHQRNGSAIDVYEALAVFLNSRIISAPVQAQEPVAWMTEDGRVSTNETKLTAMASTSRPAFNIPLFLHPVQSVAVPDGADKLIKALKDIAEACNCCGDRSDLSEIANDALGDYELSHEAQFKMMNHRLKKEFAEPEPAAPAAQGDAQDAALWRHFLSCISSIDKARYYCVIGNRAGYGSGRLVQVQHTAESLAVDVSASLSKAIERETSHERRLSARKAAIAAKAAS